MTAAFLSAEAGIAGATVENTAAYCAHWLEALEADPRALVLAAQQAQKAADRITGRDAKAEAAAA